MTRTLFVIATLLLTLVPAASAWPWDPVEVRVAEMRVGDVRLVEMEREGAVVRREVFLVEGPSAAADRFGIERAAVALRYEEHFGDELRAAERCHLLRGGREAVAHEHLGGEPRSSTRGQGGSTDLLTGTTSETSNSSLVRWFGGRCPGVDILAGRALAEGSTLRLAELYTRYDVLDATSEPARAAEYDGRPALLYVFPMNSTFEGTGAGSRVEFLVADGLPAPALMRVVGGERDWTSRIVGFTPGGGAPVPLGDATLPERNPSAAFVPYDRLRLDDSGLALPLPFEEAFGALLADPLANADAYFDSHPDAVLMHASYWPEPPASEPRATGRGAWTLGYLDGSTATWFTVREVGAVSTPAGLLALPASRYEVTRTETVEEQLVAPERPAEVARTADLVAAARALGVDAPAPRLHYWFQAFAGGPTMMSMWITELREEGALETGEEAQIDPVAGSVEGVSSATFRSTSTGGILGERSAPPRIDAAQAEAPLLAVAPRTLAGAAAAATGLGLLALVVKLVLAPLYSRLRRDRLLDDPVRAALYERVRAQPGIHRAALIEHARVGEGATRHHLEKLVKERLLVEIVVDGFARYFAAGAVPPTVARREAVLLAGSHRAVYELYATRPGASLREAAHELGMSAPSVHRAKKRLEKAGLLPAAPAASVRVAEA